MDEGTWNDFLATTSYFRQVAGFKLRQYFYWLFVTKESGMYFFFSSVTILAGIWVYHSSQGQENHSDKEQTFNHGLDKSSDEALFDDNMESKEDSDESLISLSYSNLSAMASETDPEFPSSPPTSKPDQFAPAGPVPTSKLNPLKLNLPKPQYHGDGRTGNIYSPGYQTPFANAFRENNFSILAHEAPSSYATLQKAGYLDENGTPTEIALAREGLPWARSTESLDAKLKRAQIEGREAREEALKKELDVDE